jgi:hypothetical protein
MSGPPDVGSATALVRAAAPGTRPAITGAKQRMGGCAVVGDGVGVAGGDTGVGVEEELVATGVAEPDPAGGKTTPGGVASTPPGFEIGPPVVRPPIVPVPDPQQKLGDGVALGLGVPVSAGGEITPVGLLAGTG